jgi:RHS repeat-associated protein
MLREIHDLFGNRVELVYASGRLTTVRAFGRELRLSHDAKGRVVRVTAWAAGAAQQSVTYAYTQYGELARATDALGHHESWAYDGLHRMVKATLKNGVSFYYEYDDDLDRCVHTWGDGDIHDIELTYDMQAGTTVAADEEVRVYTFDERGEVLKEATPDGDLAIEYAWDPDYLLLSTKNAAGETWEYEYDDRGNRVLTRDPAGNESRWHYRGDLPVRGIGNDGLVTEVTYNAQGAPIQVTTPKGEIYKLGYDGAGHLVYVYVDEAMLYTWAYDERHDLVQETDPRGAKTTFAYDPMGRVIAKTDALGRVTRIEYDALGRPIAFIHPDKTRETVEYDALGSVTKTVDTLGRSTRMEYGGTGVLLRQTMPDGKVWEFAYDGNERLREVTNPKKEKYAFEHDRAGRVVEERTFDRRVIKYQYTKASRLRRVEYPDGTWRELAYDPLGNLVEDASPHGDITFARDPIGRLVEAVVNEHSGKTVVKLERDALGFVVKEIQNDAVIEYTHDTHGRRKTRKLPSGETTSYAYDRGGGLVEIRHDGHVVKIERDVLGRDVRRRSGKVLEIESAYDVRGRPERRTAKAAERAGEEAQRVVSERRWSYDARSRLTSYDDSRWGKAEFHYDEVGQLIEARRGKQHEVFYYDAAGSLSAVVEGLTSRAVPWTIAEGDVLTQAEQTDYAYDARRRRTKKVDREKGTTEYFWDVRDRLREVALPSGERVLYTYDAMGRRVRKEIVPPREGPIGDPASVRVVSFLWDGHTVAQEIDTERGKRVYVHTPRGLTPILQAERGEVFTYVLDHLGAAKELIDTNGRVSWSAACAAYGAVVETWRDPLAKPAETPLRAPGQYFDDETGLFYTRFRYFEPDTARWLSPDPLGIVGGANLFGFNGAPTNDVDPFGLCVVKKLQALAMQAYKNVMADPAGKIEEHLSDRQRDALEKKPFLDRCFFGTIVESELDALIRADPELSQLVSVRTGPGPDYEGSNGTTFDLTTDNPGTVGAHFARTGANEIDVVLPYPALTDAQLEKFNSFFE